MQEYNKDVDVEEEKIKKENKNINIKRRNVFYELLKEMSKKDKKLIDVTIIISKFIITYISKYLRNL